MFNNKMDIDGKIYDLSYSVSKSDDGKLMLSIVKKYNNKIIDKSSVKVAPITFEVLEEIVRIMCRNTVTPACSREIAEEMVMERTFVE